MTCTIATLLSNAKQLADRLKDHDSSADAIVSQTEHLHKHINSMRTYQDEIENINESQRNKPRAQLIKCIQFENRQIKELQKENQELRLALDEHQSALELIMSKYRDQVNMLTQHAKLDLQQLRNPYQQELKQRNEKILEMVGVMQQVVRLDDASSFQAERRIAQLENENRTLRELLTVSNQFRTSLRSETDYNTVKKRPATSDNFTVAAAAAQPSPNQNSAESSSNQSCSDSVTNQKFPDCSSAELPVPPSSSNDDPVTPENIPDKINGLNPYETNGDAEYPQQSDLRRNFGSVSEMSDTDSDCSSNASTMTLTPCTSDREEEDFDSTSPSKQALPNGEGNLIPNGIAAISELTAAAAVATANGEN